VNNKGWIYKVINTNWQNWDHGDIMYSDGTTWQRIKISEATGVKARDGFYIHTKKVT